MFFEYKNLIPFSFKKESTDRIKHELLTDQQLNIYCYGY